MSHKNAYWFSLDLTPKALANVSPGFARPLGTGTKEALNGLLVVCPRVLAALEQVGLFGSANGALISTESRYLNLCLLEKALE